SSTRLSRSPRTSRARRTRSPRSPSAPATTHPSPRPLTDAGPLPSSSSPTIGRAQCRSNQSFFFAFGHSFGGVTFAENCVQGNSSPPQGELTSCIDDLGAESHHCCISIL